MRARHPAVLGTGVAVLQQPLSAIIYAVLNVATFRRPRFFVDYIHEYLLWRFRMPTHGMSFGEKAANVAALAFLVAAAVVIHQRTGGRDQ